MRRRRDPARVERALDALRGGAIGRANTMPLLLDEAAHRQHLAANPLEIFVEAAGDVMAQVCGFHDYSGTGRDEPNELGRGARNQPIIAERVRAASPASAAS